MFTGLVQHAGRIVSIEPSPAGKRLSVDAAGWDHRPGHGESISVSGCCLTLAAHEPADASGRAGVLAFDVIPQTLSLTTLGARTPGDRVNLERSLTASDLMGGHLVQGHVDGVGVVEGVVTEGEWRVRVRPPAELMRYMVPQGSVAIEGVSLTLAGVSDVGDASGRAGWIEVALIPTTLELTTLGDLRPGDRVNIEADVLAKTIAHQVERALAWRRNAESTDAAR
ncbi:MAG: riboflavin synthase [Phycisphaerales bacterium]|jgi:riboflavin synthase alpha subunit|nr:riboflavin synthase [Phycisphaerales bacterium]